MTRKFISEKKFRIGLAIGLVIWYHTVRKASSQPHTRGHQAAEGTDTHMKKANEKIDDTTYYDEYGRRRIKARGDYEDPVTAEITLRGQMVVNAKSEKQAKYATDVLFRWVDNFHRKYAKTCDVDPAIFAYRLNSLLDYFCDHAEAREILDGGFLDLMRNHKQDVMRIMQWEDETDA